MNKPEAESSNWARNNAKNTIRLRYWTLAWVATTAVAAFGPKFLSTFNILQSVLAVFANLRIGSGIIPGHRKYQ